MSLVKEDGVASNGVMMQMGGNVERFSGDENFDENDVASNSSGVVRKIGTWKIKYLSVQGLPKSGPRPASSTPAISRAPRARAASSSVHPQTWALAMY